MSQISRPFQIVLAVVALMALVWVVALHRPSSGSSESKSSAESPAPSVAPAKAAPGASAGAGGSASSGGSSIYHGAAPGVEGLSKAIAKAHGAVATSQQNAQQLQQKSEQASSNTPGQGASTTPAPSSASPSKSGSSSASAAAPSTKAPSKTSSHAAPKTNSAPKTTPKSTSTPAVMPRQRLVERELAHGDIVALLFWSKTGADDKAVRSALYHLAGSEHSLAVHAAPAKEVASFGTITRGIQVYGTPTVLLVGKHGRTLVLTGLQDAFALRQGVSEVRHPS